MIDQPLSRMTHRLRSVQEPRAAIGCATPLTSPGTILWGSSSGSVAEPDGHRLEVAHHPCFPLGAGFTLCRPE